MLKAVMGKKRQQEQMGKVNRQMETLKSKGSERNKY